jgi:Mg-chelatase subunit ChlD
MPALGFTDVAKEKDYIIKMLGAISRGTGSGKRSIIWILPTDENQTPRTDLVGNTTLLPSPRVDWTERDRVINRAFCWHELGHHHHSQEPYPAYLEGEKVDMSSEHAMQLNVLVDVWQEHITSVDFEGAAQDLSYCQAYHANETVKQVAEEDISTLAAESRVALKLFALVYIARSDWQTLIDRSPWETMQEISDKHLSLIPRINGIKDHTNPFQEVLDILKEFNDNEPEQPKTGEDVEEEAKGKPDGKGDGEGEPKSGEPDSSKGETGEPEERKDGEEGMGGKLSYKDLMMHKHDDGSDREGFGVEIDYDHHPHEDYNPHSFKTIDVETPDGVDRKPKAKGFIKSYNKSAKVSRRIAREFQSRSQTAVEYNQKRGRLTTKHLVRGALGDPHIFQRKINRIANNADVLLAVDCSGSMNGSKAESATTAATALAVALELARVPVKIIGYTEHGTKLKHFLMKDWNESAQVERTLKRFACIRWSQNADGDSLMECYRDLQSRGNERQVLIVLSDGMPCCNRHGDASTYLKKVCKFIESKIELYGIGIETDSVKRYFKENTVIHTASQIESVLTDVVRNKIIRSN